MRQEEKLNDLAAHEIAALEAEGIKLTAAEVVQLNALGWSVETPEARRHLARGVPVPVGGVFLWPLTLRGHDWLERASGDFSAKDGCAAVAYAMANAYSDGNELDATGRMAVDAVRKWAKSLRCTATELEEAVDQVQSQDAAFDLPPDPDGKPMSAGDFLAFLSAACGGDVEFWERRCAFGYALAHLAAVVKQNAADGRPTAGDPKIQANRALGMAVAKIRERAKAESNG